MIVCMLYCFTAKSTPLTSWSQQSAMAVASPLSVSFETTSVSLVADIEADSHPDLPSVRHTDEPQQGWNSGLALPSLLGWLGEVITGCQLNITYIGPPASPTLYYCARLIWHNSQWLHTNAMLARRVITVMKTHLMAWPLPTAQMCKKFHQVYFLQQLLHFLTGLHFAESPQWKQ